MRFLKYFLIVLLLFIGIAGYLNYPKLNIISGYAAKYMASSVFIAGHQPAMIVQNDLDMPLIKNSTTVVDKQAKIASTTVYGLKERKAIYREGLGVTLVPEDFETGSSYPKPQRMLKKIEKSYPYGHLEPLDSVFENINYDQLNKAVALAFGNNEVQKTRTLVVLYKGHLLYERYVDGFEKETPVLGWSMTKSLLATCFGILEHHKKIEVDWPAPVAEWKSDPRKEITLNHLLRMQSGLEWEEDYSKISDVTQMLFLDNDMTVKQREKKAIAAPTAVWNYSSGTTNLLSGILRQQFRTHQDYLDFPYVAFLDKIGAHSMLLETDMAGNFVGSSYAWATTRDWAKVGLLYLNTGNWNGAQLFDPSWVSYITTPTEGSDNVYGAHFWLNAGGKYPDVPKDLYSLNGFQGQYVFIIPSKDLVVVRTGLAEYPEFDVNSFLSALTTAIE